MARKNKNKGRGNPPPETWDEQTPKVEDQPQLAERSEPAAEADQKV